MKRGVLAALVAVVVLTGASAARAQTEEELQRAREAFGEGVALSEQGRWAEAAARFREVMEVRATAQVKYNLAVALHGTGALVEASELLREVVDDSDLDRRTRGDARHLLESIEPRIGQLTVHVQGDAPGARVMLDEEELPPERVGASVAVDPGVHRVELRAAGRVVDGRTVSVGEGESVDVNLDAPAVPAPAETAAALPEVPAEPESSGESVFGQWWFWTGVGSVVVAVVLMGILAASGGDEDPVQGNLSPGVIEVRP